MWSKRLICKISDRSFVSLVEWKHGFGINQSRTITICCSKAFGNCIGKNLIASEFKNNFKNLSNGIVFFKRLISQELISYGEVLQVIFWLCPNTLTLECDNGDVKQSLSFQSNIQQSFFSKIFIEMTHLFEISDKLYCTRTTLPFMTIIVFKLSFCRL